MIEITNLNGFTLLFEDEVQRSTEQELEIKWGNSYFNLYVDITAYYLDKHIAVDDGDGWNEWDLDDVDVDIISMFNESAEELTISKEERALLEVSIIRELKNK